jgi:hypothetical protein
MLDALLKSAASPTRTAPSTKMRGGFYTAADFAAMIERSTGRTGGIKRGWPAPGTQTQTSVAQPAVAKPPMQAGSQTEMPLAPDAAGTGLFDDKIKHLDMSMNGLDRRAWMEQNQIDDYSGNTWRKSIDTFKSELKEFYRQATLDGQVATPKIKQQLADAMARLDAHEKKVMSGEKLDMADGMRTGLIVGQDPDGMMKQVEWDVLREHQRGLRAAGREQTEAERFSDWIKLSVRRER